MKDKYEKDEDYKIKKENSRNVEIIIEYMNYDGYDARSEIVDATFTTGEDEWTIEGEGFAEPQTFCVVEERNKIMVAPVGEYGVSTTLTAGYEPGTGRVQPKNFEHEEKSVKAIIGDAVDETLGKLVAEAREQFVSERGIQSASEFDIPDIDLMVREGQPLFPSSKIGETVAPRDRLVVETQSDDVSFVRWQDAIVETTNRYEVWAGNPIKDTDQLLAPEAYGAGDTLTLTEYLDAFYTVNPQSVVEAVVPQEEIEKAEKQEVQRDRLESEHPELRYATINNLDAFDEAEKAGERIEVAEQTDNCSDRNKECNLDLITYYATPAGELEVNRVHTY